MNIFSKEGQKNFFQYVQKTRVLYEKFEDSELKNKLINDLDNFENKYSSYLIRYLDAKINFINGNSSKGKLEKISREITLSFTDFGKSFVSDVRAKAKENFEKEKKKFWKNRQN